MGGRVLQLHWQDDSHSLFRMYRAEQDPELRSRLQALWLLRQGRRMGEVADIVGVHYRTIQQWVAWYRRGGVAEVLRHRHGGCQGRTPLLTREQQLKLVERANSEGFSTIGQAVEWVEKELGTTYTYWGMRWVFQRLKLKKKGRWTPVAKSQRRRQLADASVAPHG